MYQAVFMRFGERTTRLTQKHDDALGRLRSEALHHAVAVHQPEPAFLRAQLLENAVRAPTVRAFTAELRARTHAARVREDFLTGARSGVNGTPTFFINGLRHNGSYELPSLLAAIEGAAGARTPVNRVR
jgi:hypothetical protein